MRKPLLPTLTRLVAVFALLFLFMTTPTVGWSSWPGETVRAASFEGTILFQEGPSEEEIVPPEPVDDPSALPEAQAEPGPQTEPLPDEVAPAPIDEHLEHPEWSDETRRAAQLVDQVAGEIEADMNRKNDQAWSDVNTLSRMYATRGQSLNTQAVYCFAAAMEAGDISAACHCWDAAESAVGEGGSLHVVYIHEIEQRIRDYEDQVNNDLATRLLGTDWQSTGVMAEVGLVFQLSEDDTYSVYRVAVSHETRLKDILADSVGKLQDVLLVLNEFERGWSASIRSFLDSSGCRQ